MNRTVHFVVPGSLEQRTGGYLYDARMVQGLGVRGWTVHVHNLEGSFPDPDGRAASSLDRALGGLEAGALVLMDGLAMGGLPHVVQAHAGRLRLVGLVHHPLADETGLASEERDRLFVLERDALAAVRGVVVSSPFTARRLEEYGVAPERIRAVVPGTEPVSEGPSSTTQGTSGKSAGGSPTVLGKSDGVPELLCVGTVTPRKGHDLLVRALARIQELAWRCICAGSLTRDPGFVARVRGEVETAGLGSRIVFIGELEAGELEARYQAASLFVFPSHYEGYGMALTEALARGLPVVSTTGGAIPYTVPPQAAILVPPGDVEALARALRALLTDEEGRAARAAAARRHAATLPDWARQAEAFEAAIQEVATGG